MANMGYCRFRNTLQDLLDCREALDEAINDLFDDMDREELAAARRLISLCREIADDYGD